MNSKQIIKKIIAFWLLSIVFIACSSSSVFRVDPVRPVPELINESLNAHPPLETGEFRSPELVELVKLDTTIHLDIRYASTNNFLSTKLYSESRAFLQKPAAEAVVRASNILHSQGFGIIVHDAYRPWYITKVFWDATPEDKHDFVADPVKGSRHNRGCAVDLSLYNLKTGEPEVMPSGYDEMTERAHINYAGGTDEETKKRDLLRTVMEGEGFKVYEAEWWHYDYKDYKIYPIQNVRFEEIK